MTVSVQRAPQLTFICLRHFILNSRHFRRAVFKEFTHIRESTTGADGVIVAHPALIVWVLSSGQNILVSSVVGLLIQHPAATLHLDGVATAKVGVHVRAVGVALIGASLEVSVLIKYDLS